MIINVVLSILVVLFVSSCDMRGTADCRFADGIQFWTESQTGHPEVVELDGNGNVSLALNGFYAQYVSGGEPLETEGMPMVVLEQHGSFRMPCGGSQVAYYPSTDIAFNFGGETGEDGILPIEVMRNFATPDFYTHLGSIRFGHPNRPDTVWSSVGAAYENRWDCSGSGPNAPFIPYQGKIVANCYGTTMTYLGGYYFSGTQPVQRKYLAKMSNPIGTCSGPTGTNSAPNAPDFGVALASKGWVRDKSDGGFANVGVLGASMTRDPNMLAKMRPYRFQAIVRCAQTVNINGASLTGRYIISQPDGRKLYYNSSATVVGSGDYLDIQSDGVLPVEPYCYKTNGVMNPPDPYYQDDVLIVPLKLNYMGGVGTKIEYEITGVDALGSIEAIAPYWLSNNKTLDRNKDGIVNLRDMQ